VSDDFKDLINSLICYDPAQRLTISEIKSHPWYKEKACSIEEIKAEYKNKEQEFLAFREQKKKEIQEQKDKKKEVKEQPFASKVGALKTFHMMQGISPFKHRSIEAALNEQVQQRLEQSDVISNKESREYVFTGFKGVREIIYDVSPDMMFKLLLLISKMKFNTFKVDEKRFRIKGKQLSSNIDNFSGEIIIEVNSIENESSCIIFTRKSGNSVLFLKYIEDDLRVAIDKALKDLLQE
jgi:serine/threonine protein kinase